MSLDIKTNYSLRRHNTLAIESLAQVFIEIHSLADLAESIERYGAGPYLVVGGGSNLLFDQAQIDVPVLWINMTGIELLEEDNNQAIVRAMAGENWHQFVLWCLQHDYGGLENLSLIPGSVGAAPVQNIGAYGVEVKDALYQVEAFNLLDGSTRIFSRHECRFSYRDSVFKHQSADAHWVITAVIFRLSRGPHALQLDYGAIGNTLQASGIGEPTIRDVSKAVIQIRQQRLPDPQQIPNAGSFFKNPVVSRKVYRQLLEENPGMPCFELPDEQVKIPAGWLIDQCGWKGKRLGNCAVHEQHALVLINPHHATADELLELARQIQASVRQRFGLSLSLEVNLGSGTTLG
jgi:UDP-N-acetylmuramate dehydrogenase